MTACGEPGEKPVMQKTRTLSCFFSAQLRYTGSTLDSHAALPNAVSPARFKSTSICRVLDSSSAPVATGRRAATPRRLASSTTPDGLSMPSACAPRVFA